MSYVYISTRDVFSDPATNLNIVVPLKLVKESTNSSANASFVPHNLISHRRTSDYLVAHSDVEVTSGWEALLRGEITQPLTVCMMHSFGKCTGRKNDTKDCQQLHIKADSLNALRKSYTAPQREYLSRTVRATIDDALLGKITRALAKIPPTPQPASSTKNANNQFANRAAGSFDRVKSTRIEYLEFRINNVLFTTGLVHYEVLFKEWLAAPKGSVSSAFKAGMHLCTDFVTTGSCPHGEECLKIHATATDSLTRDRVVVAALKAVSKPPLSMAEKEREQQEHEDPMMVTQPTALPEAKPSVYSLRMKPGAEEPLAKKIEIPKKRSAQSKPSAWHSRPQPQPHPVGELFPVDMFTKTISTKTTRRTEGTNTNTIVTDVGGVDPFGSPDLDAKFQAAVDAIPSLTSLAYTKTATMAGADEFLSTFSSSTGSNSLSPKSNPSTQRAGSVGSQLSVPEDDQAANFNSTVVKSFDLPPHNKNKKQPVVMKLG